MLVRATQKGYYGTVIREPGQIFRIKDPKHFSEHGDPKLNGLGWMEKVTDEAAPLKKGRRAQPIGNRPLPPDEDEIARRTEEADRIADEATAQDQREADVI